MNTKRSDRKHHRAARGDAGGTREWWLPLALLMVLILFTVLSLTLAEREQAPKHPAANGTSSASGSRGDTVALGPPVAEVHPMFVAGPGSLIDEFTLALVCVADRYPFPEGKLTPGYISAHVSQTLLPNEDYIVLFFAPETGSRVKDEVWLRIRDAVREVRDERVFGIIENHSGKLTVFKQPEEIARELKRLRAQIEQAEDQGTPSETARKVVEGHS